MGSRAAVLALLALAHPLPAQSQAPAPRVLRGWEVAAVLGITAGAMVLDQGVRHILRREPKHVPGVLVRSGDLFGNVRYVGPTILASILAGVVVSDTSMEAVSTRVLETTALSAVSALALKSAIGRRRPDVAPNTAFSFRPFAFKGNSLPSGHTAIAFAVATSLASETKDHWSDALFYGAGTLTAFARINDDKHWLSDTILGAAVGILSARLVQHWNRKSPEGTPVVALHLTF